MGSYPSQDNNVPSIHQSSSDSETGLNVGKIFGAFCVNGTKVVLDNMKVLSPTLGPVGIIGSKLASVLLLSVYDELFKGKMNLKQLLAQIKDTFHDELTILAVDKVEGTVQGLQTWVTVELKHRGATSANWSPKDIWEDFYPKVDRLRDDIDMLMTQRFKETTNLGLIMFITAAYPFTSLRYRI